MKRLTTWLFVASLAFGLCACGEAPVEPTEAPTEPVVQAPVEEELVTEEVVEGSLENLGGVDYTVVVIDQNENAVPGVQIRLESEEGTLYDTDELGVASFTMPAGQYSVTIVRMPDGYSYSEDARSFAFAENSNHLTIVLYCFNVEFAEEGMEVVDSVDEGYIEEEDYIPEG